MTSIHSQRTLPIQIHGVRDAMLRYLDVNRVVWEPSDIHRALFGHRRPRGSRTISHKTTIMRTVRHKTIPAQTTETCSVLFGRQVRSLLFLKRDVFIRSLQITTLNWRYCCRQQVIDAYVWPQFMYQSVFHRITNALQIFRLGALTCSDVYLSVLVSRYIRSCINHHYNKTSHWHEPRC